MLAVRDEICAKLAMTTVRVIVIHTFLAIVLAGAEFAHLKSIALDAFSLVREENIANAS